MKRLYWRPQKCPKNVILSIGLLSIIGMLSVELLTTTESSREQEQKLAAARLAQQSMEAIKQERIARGHAINNELDPTGSGLIGLPLSPVTSIAGELRSKQTAINPNFAAAVVDMLVRAGVNPGDFVAVGYTGSFPGANVAVCAALETLQVKPIIISSGAASQYGGNIPDFMWIDMERHLHSRGLISFRSVTTSIGGYEDRGLGMPDEARQLITAAVRRNDLPLLACTSFTDSIDKRMQIYREHSRGAPIAAYINVGGGTVSTGRALGRKHYEPGLNLQPPPEALQFDSVMTRFVKQGVPVIHISEMTQLATTHDFPRAPAVMPVIGSGNVYAQPQYNRWLAACVLLLLVGTLRAFVLTDWGYRVVNTAMARVLRRRRDSECTLPAGAELMV